MKYKLIAALSLSILIIGCSDSKSSEVENKELKGVYTKDYTALESQESKACPDGLCPGLGNGFYLPETNILSNFSGGAIFFKNRLLGECTTVNASQSSSRGITEINSMEQLVSTMMASADLSGSYKTAALTAKGSTAATTGSSSDITTTFHSSILDVTVVKNSIDFNQNIKCFSEKNLEEEFLNSFQSLASIDKSNVSNSASWSPYVEFLKIFGSHIMMQQQIGSRFQQWESSTSTESDIQNTLDAKACAEVEGVSTSGGWSAKGCAAYSQEEKLKALKTSSYSKKVIEGGTKEARTKITQDVTKESLNEFIASSEFGDEAVRFMFKPIWSVLINIYSSSCKKSGDVGCNNLQRAYNLQAAYEGWTAIGCTRQVRGVNQDIPIQEMVIAGTSNNGIDSYACSLAKTGCQSNDSCHLGGAGSVCYCYGPDCVDQGDLISGTNEYRDKVRGDQSGSYDEGVNNSCYYKFIAHCNCDSSWAGGLTKRNIYLQSGPN